MLSEKNPELAALLPYKSLSTALLFSVFLGPIGLLYASLRGGIMMLLVAFVTLTSRLPIPIILTWVFCCVWSVMAINRYNHKLMIARLRMNGHEEKNYPPAELRSA